VEVTPRNREAPLRTERSGEQLHELGLRIVQRIDGDKAAALRPDEEVVCSSEAPVLDTLWLTTLVLRAILRVVGSSSKEVPLSKTTFPLVSKIEKSRLGIRGGLFLEADEAHGWRRPGCRILRLRPTMTKNPAGSWGSPPSTTASSSRSFSMAMAMAMAAYSRSGLIATETGCPPALSA